MTDKDRDLVEELLAIAHPYNVDVTDRAAARIETQARAIEQHEAFRQEVSDAVESLVDMPRCDPDEVDLVAERLGRFIVARAALAGDSQ